MSYIIRFDPGAYEKAAEGSHSAGTSMASIVSTLNSEAFGLSGTIGPGPAGVPMSSALGGVAEDVLAVAGMLTPAFQNFARLVDAASNNDAASDAASNLDGAGGAPGGAGRGVSSCPSGIVPSVAGPAGAKPSWWPHLAAHLGGVVWPSVQTAALTSAGSAIRTAASQLQSQCTIAEAGYRALDEDMSPDLREARNAAARLVTLADEVVCAVRDLGTTIQVYAGHVEAATRECDALARQAMTGMSVYTVPGRGQCLAATGSYTTDTIGAAAAAADTKLAAAAQKISARLTTLAAQASSDASTVMSVGSDVSQVQEDLARYVSAEPSSAELTEVRTAAASGGGGAQAAVMAAFAPVLAGETAVNAAQGGLDVVTDGIEGVTLLAAGVVRGCGTRPTRTTASPSRRRPPPAPCPPLRSRRTSPTSNARSWRRREPWWPPVMAPLPQRRPQASPRTRRATFTVWISGQRRTSGGSTRAGMCAARSTRPKHWPITPPAHRMRSSPSRGVP